MLAKRITITLTNSAATRMSYFRTSDIYRICAVYTPVEKQLCPGHFTAKSDQLRILQFM